MAHPHKTPVRLSALHRLARHPGLPDVIPTLPPRTLTRLYDAVGLHDAGSLMAVTPPPLLARALNEAVWTERNGHTRFDPDVFVDWLEVWLNEGDTFTATQLLALEEDLLAVCFGALLTVDDASVSAPHRWNQDDGDADASGEAQPVPKARSTVIDRFVVQAEHEDEWELIHQALLALWDHAPDTLVRLLERLTVNDSRLEGEELFYRTREDAAASRERGRERAGFVPRDAALAFLAQARALPLADLLTLAAYDPETARHMRRLQAPPPASPPGEAKPDPRARPETPAWDSPPRRPRADGRQTPAATADPAPDPEVWSLLAAAGIVDDPPPAALLAGPRAATLILNQRLDALAAAAPAALARTASELAWLANVLIALDLTDSSRSRENNAREAAFATANLGLELLEMHGVPATLQHPPGLVQGFLLAWRTLAELPDHLSQACARALTASPAVERLDARPWLRADMQQSLVDLEDAVGRHDHGAAREAVGLLSLALNATACRAAVHLLDAPPRFPRVLDGGTREAARWIATIDDLERLGELLRGL